MRLSSKCFLCESSFIVYTSADIGVNKRTAARETPLRRENSTGAGTVMRLLEGQDKIAAF